MNLPGQKTPPLPSRGQHSSKAMDYYLFESMNSAASARHSFIGTGGGDGSVAHDDQHLRQQHRRRHSLPQRPPNWVSSSLLFRRAWAGSGPGWCTTMADGDTFASLQDVFAGRVNQDPPSSATWAGRQAAGRLAGIRSQQPREAPKTTHWQIESPTASARGGKGRAALVAGRETAERPRGRGREGETALGGRPPQQLVEST